MVLLAAVLGLISATGIVVEEHFLGPPEESPAAAPLRYHAGLRHMAADPGAPGPGGHIERRTLILYQTGHAYEPLSHEYAVQIANLASRGGAWKMLPVEEYGRGVLRQYQAAIYIGVNAEKPLPSAFLADVAAGATPVLWMGQNIDQLFAAQPAATAQYGWWPRGPDTIDVTSVQYAGEELIRDAPDSTVNRVDVGLSGAAVTLGMAQHESGTAYPWAVRSGNLTYVGEVPFDNVYSARDRYIAVTDIILQLVAPDAPERKRALIRIEDVGPNTNPEDIRRIADYLSAQQVPFSLATYPYYRDPKGAAHRGKPVSFRLVDAPDVVEALQYARQRGGTVIMHGYSHQFESLDNPYDGSSGADFEFYAAHVDSQNDVKLDGPVPGDSRDWASERLATGRGEFVRVGLPDPEIFEFPHYAGSGVDYQSVHEMFGVRYDQGTYYSGQCVKGICSTVADPGSEGRSQQFFPYPVRDVYGSVVIPENIGNISVAYNNNRPRSAQDIVANAKAIKVVRDSVASAFFHPYLPTGELDSLVRGIKEQGFEFVSPHDILGVS